MLREVVPGPSVLIDFRFVAIDSRGMARVETSRQPSRLRLATAWVLVLTLPWFLAGVAAAATPSIYWVKGVADGFAVLLSIYFVARLAGTQTFRVVSLGFGIPFGLMFSIALGGYLTGPPAGATVRFTVGSVAFFGAIWPAGLALGYLLDRRFHVVEPRAMV
jgi:hypothetical protein